MSAWDMVSSCVYDLSVHIASMRPRHVRLGYGGRYTGTTGVVVMLQ